MGAVMGVKKVLSFIAVFTVAVFVNACSPLGKSEVNLSPARSPVQSSPESVQKTPIQHRQDETLDPVPTFIPTPTPTPIPIPALRLQVHLVIDNSASTRDIQNAIQRVCEEILGFFYGDIWKGSIEVKVWRFERGKGNKVILIELPGEPGVCSGILEQQSSLSGSEALKSLSEKFKESLNNTPGPLIIIYVTDGRQDEKEQINTERVTILPDKVRSFLFVILVQKMDEENLGQSEKFRPWEDVVGSRWCVILTRQEQEQEVCWVQIWETAISNAMIEDSILCASLPWPQRHKICVWAIDQAGLELVYVYVGGYTERPTEKIEEELKLYQENESRRFCQSSEQDKWFCVGILEKRILQIEDIRIQGIDNWFEFNGIEMEGYIVLQRGKEKKRESMTSLTPSDFVRLIKDFFRTNKTVTITLRVTNAERPSLVREIVESEMNSAETLAKFLAREFGEIAARNGLLCERVYLEILIEIGNIKIGHWQSESVLLVQDNLGQCYFVETDLATVTLEFAQAADSEEDLRDLRLVKIDLVIPQRYTEAFEKISSIEGDENGVIIREEVEVAVTLKGIPENASTPSCKAGRVTVETVRKKLSIERIRGRLQKSGKEYMLIFTVQTNNCRIGNTSNNIELVWEPGEIQVFNVVFIDVQGRWECKIDSGTEDPYTQIWRCNKTSR